MKIGEIWKSKLGDTPFIRLQILAVGNDIVCFAVIPSKDSESPNVAQVEEQIRERFVRWFEKDYQYENPWKMDRSQGARTVVWKIEN